MGSADTYTQIHSCGRITNSRKSTERWFSTLTERQIRRGTHRSTRQLEDAIRDYLEINNAEPKPFIWTKSADAILASIERFCLRISNSPH
jgi:hypothetical protein